MAITMDLADRIGREGFGILTLDEARELVLAAGIIASTYYAVFPSETASEVMTAAIGISHYIVRVTEEKHGLSKSDNIDEFLINSAQ